MSIESIALDFTYTLEYLRELRACLLCNVSLSGALVTFSSLRAFPTGFPWRQYLEFAEQIKSDRYFPEKHFAVIGTDKYESISKQKDPQS